MKKVWYIIFILFVFGGCQYTHGSKEFHEIDLQHPLPLSPIYYIGKISIDRPVVVMLDSTYYIASEKTHKDKAQSMTGRKDVVLYLTDSLLRSRYRIWYEQEIDYPEEIKYMAENSVPNIEDNLVKRDITDVDYSIYDFAVPPRNFILVMISDMAHEVCVKRDEADSLDSHVIWNTSSQTAMFIDGNGSIECRSDYITGYEFSNNYIPAIMPIYSK